MAVVPTRMRAIVLTEVGGAQHLAEQVVDVPVPAPDEVLVRVATVAVNRQDVNLITGRIPTSHLVFPHVLGLDPAGVVVAHGDAVSSIEAGQRIVVRPPIACGECRACEAGEDDACEHISSIGIHRPGGMAEYVSVPAKNVAVIADDLTFAKATAVAHSFPVALTLLRRAGLRSRETVLVSGAAGAVGSAAVQLARSQGASVVAAVSGSDGKTWLGALPQGLAPDLIVEYGDPVDFAGQVRERFPAGVDVYVETASEPTVWSEALRSVARRGRVAVIGSHGGPVVELNTNWLFRQRITIYGCSGSSTEAFRETVAMAGEGRIVPNIDSILPWEQAADAYRRLLSRQNQGKVVLRVAPDDDL